MPEHHHSNDRHENENWLFSRTGIGTLGALAILGFLVYRGHSAHLLGLLPYALLFACPLMHIFMHHGHGGHGHRRDQNSDHNHHTNKNESEQGEKP